MFDGDKSSGREGGEGERLTACRASRVMFVLRRPGALFHREQCAGEAVSAYGMTVSFAAACSLRRPPGGGAPCSVLRKEGAGKYVREGFR